MHAAATAGIERSWAWKGISQAYGFVAWLRGQVTWIMLPWGIHMAVISELQTEDSDTIA